MQRVVPLGAHDPRSIGGYQLLGKLGSGGQGIVYQGRAEDGALVAVKVLHDELVPGREEHNALAKELEVTRRVAPFYTAEILSADLDADQPYIVSEYVDGPSLQQVVRSEGPRRGNTLHRLSVATATALVAVHEAGIVHRDFKPANVLIGPDGPRVIDFGIARIVEATTTTSGGLIGTPAYMAPEQAAGHKVGPPADVFAWAGVMTYAATGRPPFGTAPMAAVIARLTYAEPDLGDLPAHLRELILACLRKNPAERPTAHEVLMRLIGAPQKAATLDEVLQSAQRIASPPTRTPPSQSPPSPSPPPRDVTMSPDPPGRAASSIPSPQSGQAPTRQGPAKGVWVWAAIGAVMLILIPGILLLNVRSRYYVGVENSTVALYRGVPEKVLGLDLARKADDQPDPPIPVADLPESLRQKVMSTYSVKGPSALTDLQKLVCKYVVTAQGGRVVIVKGRGQKACQEAKVATSSIPVFELPASDAALLSRGMTFVGRHAAEAKIGELERHWQACKQSDSPLKDCPSNVSGGS